MADKSNDLLVGLDIGSSKVVCMIASPVSSSTFKIEGLGECKSEGIEQGGVVDINQAVDCVRAAVEEAEKTANTTVKTVAAGISGPHIRTDNCIQQTIVGSGEIEQKDIDDLLNTAMSVTLPPSMRYLDVIPQEYSVDYARRIRTPIGMEGKKLEGSLHVVTAQSAQCLFLNKVIRRTGLELIDSQLIFNPLAAASAVLRPEEIDLGVALIDIGSDLSDVAVFFDKAVQYSAVHPMGGQQITDEISIKTHLSQEAAEKLKLQMGQVHYDARKDKDSFIRLPTAPGYSDDGGRILSKQALSAIIDVKVQDILDVSSTELVNGLVVIAHHAEVLVFCRQQADELELGQVGVLVFVHHYVLETLLVIIQHIRVVLEQFHRLDDQVVEIHGVVLL